MPKKSTEQSFKIDGIKYEVRKIDPEFARYYIGTARNRHNRKISKRNVEQLAYAITQGRWVMTGEAIKIGNDGRLFDGQHRLQAVIEAGEPIDSLVISGLDVDALHAMDGGKKRSVADQSYIASKVPTHVTGLIQMMERMAVGPRYYVDPWEIEEIHNAYPVLEEIADAYKDAPSFKMGSVLPAMEVALREAGWPEEAELFRFAWINPWHPAPDDRMKRLFEFKNHLRDMAEKGIRSQWTPQQRKDALPFYTICGLADVGHGMFVRDLTKLRLPRVAKNAFLDRVANLDNDCHVEPRHMVHKDQSKHIAEQLRRIKRSAKAT